jgi:hypothetical protein
LGPFLHYDRERRILFHLIQTVFHDDGPTATASEFILSLMACPALPSDVNPKLFGGHEAVLARVQGWLEQVRNAGTNYTTCQPDLFQPNTSFESPVLTYKGCLAFGGPGTWYTDPGPRVLVWVLPTVFLISNIALGPADKIKASAIWHALGDPVDTIWSLLDKFRAWDRCYEVASDFVDRKREEATRGVKGPVIDARINDAKRLIAAVFAAHEELLGHHPNFKEQYVYDANTSRPIGMESFNYNDIPGPLDTEAFFDPERHLVNVEWRRAALRLTESRTNEFVRTAFSLVVYLLAILSEFVDQLSSDVKATPGGRLGSAMFLSFLIPITLLSNLIGGFPSRRTCLEIILSLKRATTGARDASHSQVGFPFLGLDSDPESWDSYFDSLPLKGVNYSFRPFKRIRPINGSRWSILIPLAAAIPVVYGFLPAMIIHHFAAPEGFSCRHLWILGLFFVWTIVSPLLTHGIYAAHKKLPKNILPATAAFWVIYAKDAAIGVGTVVLVSLSVAGYFSTCWCWTRVYWVGEEAASFPANHRPIYVANKKTTFIALAAVFYFAQVSFAFLASWWWTRGLRAVRLGEELKRKLWRTI